MPRARIPGVWLRSVAGVALGAAIALAAIAPVPASALDASVPPALDYLHACQRSDGGFAEKGAGASSGPLTAWAMVAIAATGEDCNQWKVDGHTPASFLAHTATAWSTTTDYARTILAVEAAGKDPRSFGGVDLVAKIDAGVQDRGSDGDQIGPYVNSHIWGMIGLEGASSAVTAREVHWLVSQQNADGGWGWAPGLSSDTNDAAAALQALVGAGQSAKSDAVSRALGYLGSHQLADGGFTYSGSKSDADSTAWVVQALVAGGKKPEQQRASGHDPLSDLRSLQSADGSLRYSASAVANPLLVTAQAVPALCGKAFPFKTRRPAAAVLAFRPLLAARWPSKDANVVWRAGSAIRIAVSDGGGPASRRAG